ncbi:MAG: HlyC/CorC family transporter [Saprospiraceae bacterium]|nr:hemolysin family protein [Bacteroidia bacterium]NNE14871.1 HlyC/CorC family transporter [Saprospiraceae bacterium]NNL90814.1 HlyC/CorC family transporter [Saprospiraceae bacterium]
MSLLIFFFVLSIAFSFLCSILEAVLLSITPTFIRQKIAQGSKVGLLLREYKKDIDKPLSAILTLNTIAHTVGAIGVGAVAGEAIGTGKISDAIPISYESVVAVVMTLAILILSEIIPKTIGANYWRSLSGFTVQTLRFLMFILAPLVWVSQLITKTFKNEKNKSVLSRADFSALAVEGANSGAIGVEESEIIKNLMNFESLTARDIMTPRTVAFMVEENATVNEFLNAAPSRTFSRIPVYKEGKDNITGMVLKDDILHCVVEQGGDQKIKDLMFEVNVISDSMPLPELFKFQTKERQHLSVVKDEFGTVVGLVTMEDMFETLLGQEIVDESDKVIDLQEYARQKFEEEK